MSWLSFILLTLSALGAVTILLHQMGRDRHRTLFLLGLVLLLVIVPLSSLRLPFHTIGTPRGSDYAEHWFLIVLYACLLLGMLAQYSYARFSRPRRHRPQFDIGLFMAPIFTSPIIFIPLLATVQSAGVDLYQNDSARLMLFLIAFENGFFWKLIFDQRRQLLS